jgi:polyferredoxin
MPRESSDSAATPDFLPLAPLSGQPFVSPGVNTIPGKPKKKLLRRAETDRSQQWRQGFQLAFLLLNVWLGGEFYLWVRQFETGIAGPVAERPAGVEGWLPIAGLMNLNYWLHTGRVPAIHPAAFFLLVAFLSIAFLLRKAFCSWLCPVGTLSEYLWRAGRGIFGRTIQLPRWMDIPLRGLKYLLLGFFVWAVAGMSVEAIARFMTSPYGLIADVKMLNFFRFLGTTGLTVLAVLAAASLVVPNFWCRYLCPYGALLGLVSLPSPLRIRRSAEACIDCAKCARACPSFLPVDQMDSIKSSECTACMLCVAVCPAEGALSLSLPHAVSRSPRRARVQPWALAAAVAALFLGIVGFAKTTGRWKSDVPSSAYQKLIPHAEEAQHPMPSR